MASRRLLAVLTTTWLLVFGAARSQAIMPDNESQAFEIPLRETAPLMPPIQVAGANEASEGLAARYGGRWQVALWNPLSDSPQAIIGSGIDLAQSALSDAGAADLAAGAIAANADLLRVDAGDLAAERVVRGAGKIAVHFIQRFHGIPVHGSRVHAILTETGRLFVFGSIFYRDIDVSPVPTLGAAAAAGIAAANLPTDPAAADRPLETPELLILPVPGEEGGVAYHLVWRTTVSVAAPYGLWVTHVDAHDGRILWRTNEVHHLTYSGAVQGDADQSGYCQGQFLSPLRLMYVDVDGIGTATTDSTGSFSLAGGGGDRQVSADLSGPQVNVNDTQFGDSSFLGAISEDTPLTINWTDATPSRRAERDAFYWINETYAFVKKLDGAWTIPLHIANVNANDSCNAYWSPPWTMDFFREGGGCANTAHLGDVIAHEYGHGIQHRLLGGQGSQGLGEGNADITGTFISDDSMIGRGFYLNNCANGIRDCQNALRYPENVVGQGSHSAGRVICGFNWDARQLLESTLGTADGETYTAQLWHYARKLHVPYTQPDQVLAYFIVDDDDGNLDNGTPNHADICQAAMNHGFSCPEILVGVIITHAPLRSTTDHSSAYTVSADITSTEAAVDLVELFYRIDGGEFNEVNMTLGGEDGGEAIYSAGIPASAMDSSVEYYIYCHDTLGNVRTSPALAPADLHQFFVATVVDELESASGWTAGAPGDNATTGVWERVDPIGTGAQPQDDHTPAPGTFCFVTGQHEQGQSIFDNDVDSGTTTLLSPVYDLSSANLMARVAYWRWYSNNMGANPRNDSWVVDVSNDGGVNWVNIENVNPADSLQNEWRPIEVDLISLFGAPGLVQLRFKASDLNLGSFVEAAVDDLVILARSGAAAVDDPAAASALPAVLAVRPNQPNPFKPSTFITYTLPDRAEVAVTIFDVAGRRVCSLARGFEEPGERSARWDGRDDAGRLLPAGTYYCRVTANGREATRKMVLLK